MSILEMHYQIGHIETDIAKLNVGMDKLCSAIQVPNVELATCSDRACEDQRKVSQMENKQSAMPLPSASPQNVALPASHVANIVDEKLERHLDRVTQKLDSLMHHANETILKEKGTVASQIRQLSMKSSSGISIV